MLTNMTQGDEDTKVQAMEEEARPVVALIVAMKEEEMADFPLKGPRTARWRARRFTAG